MRDRRLAWSAGVTRRRGGATPLAGEVWRSDPTSTTAVDEATGQ
jgi:hypothetical protein